MSALFAEMVPQADSLLDALKPYGIAGICVGFFMLRDLWHDWRRGQLEQEREKRLEALVASVDRSTAALNRLTRSMTIEVLTRPGVASRAKQEAQDLQDALSEKAT